MVDPRKQSLDEEQFLKRQQLLADFGDLAIRSDDLDEVLTEACRLVGEALETYRSKVLEIERGANKLRVRAAVGWDPGIVGVELDTSEHSSGTYSIRSGAPVITQDITKEERFQIPPFMKDAGVVALANVPIFVPGRKPFGLLQVDSQEPRSFDRADTQFLRTYASILGPVIGRLQAAEALQTSEERFGLIVENARDYAIFVTDANDRVVDWHKGAESIYGWTAEEAEGMCASKLFTDEDRASGEDRKEVRTASEKGKAPNVRWHLRKDGSLVFIEGSVTSLRNTDGTVRGFLKIGQDVTERHRAEQRLRESEALQRVLIEGVPQLVWRSGPMGEWIWSSPQWQDFTGQAQEASRGRGWLDPVHPDDRETALAAWEDAAAHGKLDCEFRIRRAKNGDYVWHHTRSLPAARDGRLEWLGTCTDVQQLKELQESQEVILAELQHRTRNLIAVIHSISDKTLRSSATLEEFKEAFGHRLASVARVQGLLSRLHDRERVTFDELLTAELSAHSSDRAKITLEGPQGVRLRSRAIQTFALALHELATNAVKYGALSAPEGHLTIRWRIEHEGDAPLLSLEWVETGVDNMPAVDAAPLGSGYGRELIERALPYQLKARTTYEMGEDGIRCTIRAPITFKH